MTSPDSIQNCNTFEDLLEIFTKKTSILKNCLELKYMDRDTCKMLPLLEKTMSELPTTLQKMRKEIEKGKENLAQLKDLHSRLETINHKVDHGMKNFPNVLQNQNEAKGRAKGASPKSEKLQAGHPNKTPKTPPKITALKIPEFESVPKYMKGRITYASINSFVDSFNKTIATKYQFLSTPRNQLGTASYKTYQQMKKQETGETKGLFFCIIEDLKTYGNVKTDNNTRNMLTILRHCAKIKEIRGPGPIVRFVVLE